MGAITSTTRTSLEVVSRKEKKCSKAPNCKGRTKRSSVNRPVLQLQVKPATLERVRLRLASTSGPHLVTRKTLNSLARDSGIYDSLITKSRACSNASRNSDHSHYSRTYSTGPSDSMIVLQIVKDEHGIIGKDGDGNEDYDHLIPNIDFGHLCECTYGRVSLLADVEEEVEEEMSKDERDNHMTDMTFYNRHGDGSNLRGLQSFSHILNPSIQLSTTDEVKQRIHCHQNLPSPPPSSSTESLLSSSASSHGHLLQIRTGSMMRKSISSSELMHHQINTEEKLPVRRCKTLSQGTEDESDWTLGESIIRALSRKDLLIVDVENPQHPSEFEIMAAWPRLKDEFKNQKSRSLSNLTYISDQYS